jgi:Amt family ammonium transporter
VFADASINTLPKGHGVLTRPKVLSPTIVWTAVMTYVILMVCKFTTGLRVSEEAEVEGLDTALHGEALHDHA